MLEENHEILDVGTYSKVPVDYPDYAEAVATALREYRAERGIILCGSGVGASMAANRIPGIRAGLCHDTYSAHQGAEPDVVMASCGDVATQEALAATAILREHLPQSPVCERGGSIQDAARDRAPAWLDRAGIRQPVHPSTGRSSSTSTAIPG